MKVFLQNAPKTRLIISFMSLALGGAIIGVCSPVVFNNAEFFYGLVETFSAGGGDSSFSYSAGALLAAAAGGGVMVAAGLVGLAGHFARSQVLLIIFLILSFIGSLVAVVGGGLFLQVPSIVGERIYIDDTNSITPPLDGVQKDVNDFELALFNECCSSRNWTDQPAAIACTGDNDNDCPDVTDPLVNENLPNANILLCACASSQERLDTFMSVIREKKFCAKAQKALINMVGLALPPKAGSVKLQPITLIRYPSLEYTHIPLVGFHKTVNENPDPENAAEFPLPFGCGLGYMKGIQFLIDVWVHQNAINCAVGALAIGMLNLAFMALAIAVSVIQAKEEAEYNSGARVDKWDTVKDIPASFMNTTNPVHQQQDVVVAAAPVVAVAGNGGSSGRNSLASNATPASGVDRAEIYEKLRQFYAKYDKDKNVNDLEDVANWASMHGVQALNAKLKSKYNADLNSLTGTASTGLGAKALQADLDI